MYTARKKIQKEKGLEPSEFEDSVAQAFFDLENGNQELKSELKDLYINDVDVVYPAEIVVKRIRYRLDDAKIFLDPKERNNTEYKLETFSAGFVGKMFSSSTLRLKLLEDAFLGLFPMYSRNHSFDARVGTLMYTARKKIQKEKGLEPSEFEDSVAQAFFDLENGNQELKSELKDLYINNAVQMDVAGNRKAVVIHVPYRLRKAFKKIHVRLVRELEKKFSGKDVVIVATRRIVRPPKKGSAVQRPRTRTLTAVHDGILEDVVYPAEIVGKRIRYRLDGAKVIKIFLDPKERNNTEYKLETFSAVYRRLCGKDVALEYPMTETA
uniref:40S ribosomal protein S7 n=2 Tax=Oryza punctata TaxID=4537 RepID=A0A0E0KCJ3_ORYPU